MSRDEFDALVRRLEESSRRHPRMFMARIVGLVLLAYSYLGLILFGSFALCVAIVVAIIYVPNAATIKLGLFGLLVCGGLFWAVLRGLWVRLEAPTGLVVTREQAPKLFAMLDELRQALKCQPFGRVLLMSDHNAAVVQVPRLGVFGWHRNYLLLGLALMQSLAPDEFKAVLAHEFAHSSKGHGRFGNWLYRVRRSWDRIFEQMAKQGTRGGFLLTGFIKWFWPLFNGHAFVLARANEYEADACSVRLAGADAAARALMRLPVDGSLLDENFWHDIVARTKTQKEPPNAVMRLQAEALKTGPAPEDAARWLRQAFMLETNNADTHPCLKDRLRAMERLPGGIDRGDFPPPPPRPAETAADVFLGPHGEAAIREMSEAWSKKIAEYWAERHTRNAKLSEELAQLEKPGESPAGTEQLWTKAVKLIQLGEEAAAAAAVDQVLAADPKHAGANFVRGRQLLEKDDARGVEFLETAMASDSSLTQDGCNILYGYYTRTGQRDKLRPLENRVDNFREEVTKAQQERASVTAADTFLPHLLTVEQTAALRMIFTEETDIASVAVAQKLVHHLPQNACYVISLRIKVALLSLRSSGANQQIINRVIGKLQLPGNLLVFVDEQNLKAVAKKVFAVPDAIVYDRSDSHPPPLP